MQYLMVAFVLFFGTCLVLALFVWLCWKLKLRIDKSIRRSEVRARINHLQAMHEARQPLIVTVQDLSIVNNPSQPYQAIEKPRSKEELWAVPLNQYTAAELKREIEQS